MPRYELGLNKAGVNTANTIMWVIRPVTNRAYMVELGLSVATAPTTGPDFYICRTLTLGTATTSTVPAPTGSLSPTTNLVIDSAWSVAPTIAATPIAFRRFAVPNAIGSGITWTWYTDPFELEPAATGGLAIVNGNATGATLGALNMYGAFNW